MRRREFITFLGGATVSWPLVARAQQDGRVRLVGWLDNEDENEASLALRTSLRELRWIEGRNLRVERRFVTGDPDRLRTFAAEIVSLKPDAIVAGGAAPARALQQVTHTIPIIFTRGGDAAVIGLVGNIARPDGNITGFSSSEPSIGGKWLELLKEAAPGIDRVAVVFRPEVAPTSPKYIAAIDAAATNISVQIVQLSFHDTIELVRLVDAFAAGPNGGLLMLPPSSPDASQTIIKLAAQHRLPAIYPGRSLAAVGGLISYDSDDVDRHRHAASYVDRLLRGANVADLPVQFPTKYNLIVNMKTAKAIGFTFPISFLLHADEVIE